MAELQIGSAALRINIQRARIPEAGRFKRPASPNGGSLITRPLPNLAVSLSPTGEYRSDVTPIPPTQPAPAARPQVAPAAPSREGQRAAAACTTSKPASKKQYEKKKAPERLLQQCFQLLIHHDASWAQRYQQHAREDQEEDWKDQDHAHLAGLFLSLLPETRA